jgi:hypothetical protein
MSGYTEDHLVEQPAIQLMRDELCWEVVNCYGEWALLRQGFEGQDGGVSALGREGKPCGSRWIRWPTSAGNRTWIWRRFRIPPTSFYPGGEAKTIDLSKIDFEVLERKFAKTKNKNIETQKLRALIERKLDNLIRLNASR